MYIALIIFIVLLDQATKLWARGNLIYEKIQVISGLFDLNYIENSGVAFGMFPNSRWIFVVFILVIIIYLIYTLNKSETILKSIALAFIIGGGIGNWLDRLILGYVIDFLDFSGLGFKYIFNIADCFAVVGVGLFILAVLKGEVKSEKF